MRRRVLILTTTLPARADDGTPGFVLTLASALASTYDVTILAPRVPGGRHRERIGAVEVRRFAYFPSRFEGLADGAILPNLRQQPWRAVEVPFLVLAFASRALWLARTWRPHVVNAHWIVPGGLVAWFVRSFTGVPYVLTVHGADAYALERAPFRAVKRLVLSKAAAIAAVSRDIAARLPVATGSVQVVPMGVDVAAIERSAASRRPVPGRLVFLGRLAEKKGLDVLLRAMATVPEASLVVIGDGPERGRLEKLTADLSLGDRVQFEGQRDRAAVLGAFGGASAVVIPSRVAADGDQDGTPVVLAEAMAAGVPVVASRLGGIAEHVRSGENGLLVEAGDAAALADGIRLVLAHPEEAERWVTAARAHVRDSLSLPVVSRRYQDLLDGAMRASEVPDRPPTR